MVIKRKRLSLGAAVTMPGVTEHRKRPGELKIDYAKVFSENPGHCDDQGAGGVFGLIAHEKFKELFALIAEDNRNNPGALSIKIITAGPYLKDNIIAIMNKYYPGTVFENKDAIDFYNRVDLWGPEAKWDEKLRDENALMPSTQVNSGQADKSKGNLMTKEFANWAIKQPGLEKNNVYLIDDSDAYVEGARLCQFKAVHFPTCPQDRKPDVTFDVNKVFSELTNIVKRV